MEALNPEELRQFHLIVENARREGWLSAGEELTAERAGAAVRVAAIRGSRVVEKSYPGDRRWLFQLVRDLAWGSYSSDAA